jgi:MoxR-like ATPase
MSAREQILELKDRISRSIIGQQHVMERLLLALLCNGNVLIEAF